MQSRIPWDLNAYLSQKNGWILKFSKLTENYKTFSEHGPGDVSYNFPRFLTRIWILFFFTQKWWKSVECLSRLIIFPNFMGPTPRRRLTADRWGFCRRRLASRGLPTTRSNADISLSVRAVAQMRGSYLQILTYAIPWHHCKNCTHLLWSIFLSQKI